MLQMPMMDWTGSSGIEWTLIIVILVLGLISIYLSYMILTELKEMRKVFERVEKLLESVE
ncbi:MAG TPA: hypothetical protein VJJ51_04880 [Candidatus Methanoperedens sp.]|nr:hypothetical protein [Candidatus Methanoperedens sp.]HLB70360.1 hypothetical protein [Candidatus Methanoperedens sp.]